MNIFNVITLFGGLAMFLYGMRMMGDGLKSSSSGTLKKAMERITGTPLKAFLLGLTVTAVIQSSTATIVLTSGLVGAGIISLRQSLGIIIGSNVGTTVTGQIIRLLDLNSSGTWFLQFLKPSTLAPMALIIGIIIIMGVKSNDWNKIGQIIIGFGILFSGLLTMTDAVEVLSDSGIVEHLFSRLGHNPVLAYLTGAGVAFALQSSSATIGILQAFSTSGQLTFGEIYAVLVGVYLGDCVTTAIVCNIGAKPEAKKVGIVNILFNLSKSVLILAVVAALHKMGLLDGIWNRTIYSGGIANANTIFNLSCAVILLPCVGIYEKISHRLIKSEPVSTGKYDEMLDALNPVFISTPAMAFGRCYDILLVMYQLAKTNISRAFGLFIRFDPKVMAQIEEDEDSIDKMAEELHKKNSTFSQKALSELDVLRSLLSAILDHTNEAFRKQNLSEARQVEPLEQVVDDMVNVLKQNHLERLRNGECQLFNGSDFFNLLLEAERISLHSGRDEEFNRVYQTAHDEYFGKLPK